MEKVLAAFQRRDLETFKNIILTLKNKNRTVNDALKWIDESSHRRWINQQKMLKRREAWEQKAKKCPDCEKKERTISMRLYPIENDSCHWVCWKCQLGIYVVQSITKELKKYDLLEEED